MKEEDIKRFKQLMDFRNKVNKAIEECFETIVCVDSCNALYLLADCMFNSLTINEKREVSEKAKKRREEG